MNKQKIYFIFLLLFLSPSTLYSVGFDDPIAAQIKTDSSGTFIYFYMAKEIASEGAKKSRLNSKTDFDFFFKEKGDELFWFKKNINLQSDYMKTETENILTKGIDSFENGFVPTNFLKSDASLKQKLTTKPRIVCGFSDKSGKSVYDAKSIILLLLTGSGYNTQSAKKINTIEKAKKEFKLDNLSQFDRIQLSLSSDPDDENAELITQVNEALSLQSIIAENYSGQFLSPSACQASSFEDLKNNTATLYFELGLIDETNYREILEATPTTHAKQETKPFNLRQKTKNSHNSANFVLGAGEQQQTITPSINREDVITENELKQGSRLAGSIEWSQNNNTQSSSRRWKEHHHHAAETGTPDDTPTGGEILYLREDELPYSSGSSNRATINSLGGNKFGFSGHCSHTKTPDNLKLNGTASGRTLDSNATSTKSQAGKNESSKEPSSEERKRDRQKFLNKFGNPDDSTERPT